MNREVIQANVYNLYSEMLNNNHILIAGSAGSGKSTLIDCLIHAALFRKPMPVFYMIDPKRVDLRKYRNIKPLVKRVTEPDEAIIMLNGIIDVMESRYKMMEEADVEVYNGPDIFVVIDEIADLILTRGKEITPLIQRIAQLGRAAKVHLILATQTVLATILSTPIKNNFDCIVALRTATANQSRVIIGENGAERLPRYGVGIVKFPAEIKCYELPPVDRAELNKVIQAIS